MLSPMEQKVFILPFSLLPPRLVLDLASKSKGLGNFFYAFFPMLGEDLAQAGYVGVDAITYSAASAISTTLNILASFFFILFLGAVAKQQVFALALVIPPVLGAATLGTCLVYPQMVALQHRRKIDANLIPATRQLLIQVRSGVPLFNAILSVSTGYHEVSEEFSKVVGKLNAGVSELDALSDASVSSPSLQFRKVLWQISNALKVGSDIGTALEGTLSELDHDKTEQIKRYAQELSSLTMIYMLAAIIIPSLGITMIIVIGSLLSLSVPPFVLPLVFFLLVGFQMFFLNFVSSRRPLV